VDAGADHVVGQDRRILLVGRDGGDDLGALDRFHRGGAARDPEAVPGEIAGAFLGRGGVDIVEAQVLDAEDRAEGEGLEFGLGPLPMIAMVAAFFGARCFAATADIAAVRSAVRMVISESRTG